MAHIYSFMCCLVQYIISLWPSLSLCWHDYLHDLIFLYWNNMININPKCFKLLVKWEKLRKLVLLTSHLLVWKLHTVTAIVTVNITKIHILCHFKALFYSSPNCLSLFQNWQPICIQLSLDHVCMCALRPLYNGLPYLHHLYFLILRGLFSCQWFVPIMRHIYRNLVFWSN